jgi:hypothetical protein
VSSRAVTLTVTTRTESVLYSFPPGSNVGSPTALIQGGDGNLYGATCGNYYQDGSPGAANGYGTLFELHTGRDRNRAAYLYEWRRWGRS